MVVVFCLLVIRTLIRRLESERFGILWCNLVVQYWRCRIGVWCTRAILSHPKQMHVHKGRAVCYVIKVIIAPKLSLQKCASLFMVDWV